MTLWRKSAVSIFEKYSLVIPPNMKWHQDGLPGQIVVEKGYMWSDGVEPVLMELLEGISVCSMEKGS